MNLIEKLIDKKPNGDLHQNIAEIRNIGDDAWRICRDYSIVGNQIWGLINEQLLMVTSPIYNQLEITLTNKINEGYGEYNGSHTN